MSAFDTPKLRHEMKKLRHHIQEQNIQIGELPRPLRFSQQFFAGFFAAAYTCFHWENNLLVFILVLI